MLKLDFEAQGRGSTFTLCHSHLKKRHFIGKSAIVRRLLSLAVSTETRETDGTVKIVIKMMDGDSW